MFDIGWTEMLVIAVVMIVVVGPKDLPKMLRTFGRTTAKLRAMAGDFQKQFNEALKEAELDDVKKSVDALRSMNPANEIKKQLNPFEKAAADVRAGLQSAMGPKPSTAAEPAAPAAHEAEPLKNGATSMPGVAGPEAMPAPPSIVATPAATTTPATPMPPPEPAKPMAAAAPMPDPQPAKVNGTESLATPKPAAPRAAKPRVSTAKSEAKPKAPAKAKSAAAAATPAATKAAKAKPAASARKDAEKSK